MNKQQKQPDSTTVKLIRALMILVALYLIFSLFGFLPTSSNRSSRTAVPTTARGEDCGDIGVAMHFGSAIFEKKVSGASITRVVQDNSPLSTREKRRAEEIGGIYWFDVHYTRFGETKVGRMAVNKATCVTVVSD